MRGLFVQIWTGDSTRALVIWCAFFALTTSPGALATDIVIDGPPDSGTFGLDLAVLPNGNIVVVDSSWHAGRGAAWLYSPHGQLISGLKGSQSGDSVGSGGITIVGDDFVVASPQWRNGTKERAGAATWVDGQAGLDATVSTANSLVGDALGQQIGTGVVALGNGSYVVVSPAWQPSNIDDQFNNDQYGAVTWCGGSNGCRGFVTVQNSLVGSAYGHRVGSGGVLPLRNGNYVVVSPYWDRESISEAGAVTWGNGNGGTVGEVSIANSMVGRFTDDRIGGTPTGDTTVFALANGNYVVGSQGWNSNTAFDVGAIRWGDGTQPTTGSVSPSNSLVGTTTNDRLYFTVPGTDGSFLVVAPNWDRGAIVNAGAVLRASGTSSIVGELSEANALVGSTNGDAIGGRSVALPNGQYAVGSPAWDDGAIVDAGAVTWLAATNPVVGPVTRSNSLYGTSTECRLGATISALPHGDYVITTPTCDNGSVEGAGLVKWVPGNAPAVGPVDSGNALVGSTADDRVGDRIAVLTGGDFIVASPRWDAPGVVDSGAVTRVDGHAGIVGTVALQNSLVGTTAGDAVGRTVIPGPRDSFIVFSEQADRNAPDGGAVSWLTGTTTGTIANAPSYFGASGDLVGSNGGTVQADGSLTFENILWHDTNGDMLGAVTLAIEPGEQPVSRLNSVAGPVPGLSTSIVHAYDPSHRHLVVGHPLANRVVIHSDLLLDGFD